MVAAGAKGYVLKTDAPTNVTEAIRAVAAGKTYFDKIVTRSSLATQDKLGVEELRADELAVVKCVANGRTNREIAVDLELALPVVEKYKTAAMKKLGLRTRAELVRVATLRHWFNA